MSSDLEQIPISKDVLFSILDLLSVPDLLQFLSTNSQIKSQLSPYFAEKIDDYHEDLKYRRGPARQRTQNKFELFSKYSDSAYGFILLHPNLSYFMGLNHMPKYNNQTIYTYYLLIIWLNVYAVNLTGECDITNVHIPIDVDLSRLIGMTTGTTISFNNLVNIIVLNLIDQIGFARNTDVYGIPMEDSLIIIQSLAEENNELLSIIRFQDEECLKSGKSLGRQHNLPSLNESIY